MEFHDRLIISLLIHHNTCFAFY